MEYYRATEMGYFFFSEAEDKLLQVYAELVGHGYRLEDFERRDSAWMLHVSKSEALPADKLYRRCLAFNTLAEACQADFDGWDVGKAEQ